jgi:hypothetical protein
MEEKAMKNCPARFSLSLMLLVLSQGLVGCASIQVRPAPLANVHKAAIVAFGWSVDLSSESDKNVSSSIGDIINTSKAIAEMANPAEREQPPRNAYEALSKKIDENLHWTMLQLQEVAANPAVDQTVKSIKVFGDSPAITGIMHPYQADRLSAAQRKELLEKLGVDAVLVADVKIKVGGTSGFAMAGMGSITKYPQATIALTVYGAQDEEPIWRDRWCTGDKATTGVANTMGVQNDSGKEAALAEAMTLALDKLIARYREQAGAAK